MIKNQRGSGLLLVIIVLTTLFTILAVSLERGQKIFERIHRNHLENIAFNLAEAGVEHTIHQLIALGDFFQGEKEVGLDTGTFSTSVSYLSASGMLEIVSIGKAQGKGQIGDVVRTLRIVIQFTPEDTERTVVIYSWEEVR